MKLLKKKEAIKTLEGARNLIRKHYISGYLAETAEGADVSPRSPYAVNFCSLGAVRKVDGPGESEALKLLRKAAGQIILADDDTAKLYRSNSDIFTVNDDLGKESALKMFQLAIKLAKQN